MMDMTQWLVHLHPTPNPAAPNESELFSACWLWKMFVSHYFHLHFEFPVKFKSLNRERKENYSSYFSLGLEINILIDDLKVE